MAGFGEGDAKSDLLWLVGIFVLLGFLWFFTGGPKKSGTQSLLFNNTPKTSSSSDSELIDVPAKTSSSGSVSSPSKSSPTKPVVSTSSDSIYKGKVKLGRGSAGNNISSLNLEYVTLRAASGLKEPINITGWKIKNGKDEKTYEVSGRQIKGVSDVVAIPKGTNLFNGSKVSVTEPITLKSNDTAIVTTGRFPNTVPYPVNLSFRTNKCSGYLESMEDYKFTPYLSSRCPYNRDEPGADSLSDSCYAFVKNISGCRIPVIKRDNKEGIIYVDNRTDVSSTCRNFITEHFTYEGCLKYHQTDKDFSGNEWRIFLNRSGFLLYSKTREKITLLDTQGKIVDQISY